MKLLNAALVKITLFFIAGILAGFYLRVSLNILFLIIFSCLIFFAFSFFRAKKLFLQDIWFGTACFLMFFALGTFTTALHLPKNQAQHYTNHLNPKNIQDEKEVMVIGRIIEILNSNPYSHKYIVALQKIEKQKVNGKILLNVKKDSLDAPLAIDDRIVLKTNLQPINSPKNPYQFNYRKFMKNRDVFLTAYSPPNEIFIIKAQKPSLLGLAENIRNQIVATLKENGLSKTQLAMIQALLLGQDQDIPDETYDNYAAAGVIHILSVSGLHVGFVLLIFNFLLKPLESFKLGRPIKVVLLIVLLWGFALLAGFSSPVVRSVSMFSFVAIGLNINRKTSILNVLFMSLFAILLFAPKFIFEVGFQLSYLAVFSIVIFQPLFYRLYHPKFLLDKSLWGIITVTLAAQIGVMPLSLFYFHQFPGLFFISNLLVIPFVGFILGFGILVILLAFLNLLPKFLAESLGECTDLLNAFVAWCANQEAFLFQNIHFSALQMLFAYLVIFCVVLAVWNFNYKKLVSCLVAGILLISTFIYEKQRAKTSAEFLVFHKSRNTILGFKKGEQLNLKHNLSPGTVLEEYAIKNYITGEGVTRISSAPIKNIYKIRNRFLLVIDSAGIYQLPKLENSMILLRNSPQINLDRLIETLDPKIIISDGSNYKSYVKRWRKTCRQGHVPFYYTGKKGAFAVEF
ncbi:MAG TPA: ComEC/Rec2 family competence protein [Salinimicrobium sp.]|nr:ComEC/Rec2 family competence protein [Salinimicrobium sp.]